MTRTRASFVRECRRAKCSNSTKLILPTECDHSLSQLGHGTCTVPSRGRFTGISSWRKVAVGHAAIFDAPSGKLYDFSERHLVMGHVKFVFQLSYSMWDAGFKGWQVIQKQLKWGTDKDSVHKYYPLHCSGEAQLRSSEPLEAWLRTSGGAERNPEKSARYPVLTVNSERRSFSGQKNCEGYGINFLTIINTPRNDLSYLFNQPPFLSSTNIIRRALDGYCGNPRTTGSGSMKLFCPFFVHNPLFGMSTFQYFYRTIALVKNVLWRILFWRAGLSLLTV